MKTKKEQILEYLADGYSHRDIATAFETSERYVDLIYNTEFSDYEEPFDRAIMFEPLTDEDQCVALKGEYLQRYLQCRDFRDQCKMEGIRWSESLFRNWIKTKIINNNN